MATLHDLTPPFDEMTDTQLEELLAKLRLNRRTERKEQAVKTRGQTPKREKLADQIKALSPEQKLKLAKLLKGVE